MRRLCIYRILVFTFFQFMMSAIAWGGQFDVLRIKGLFYDCNISRDYEEILIKSDRKIFMEKVYVATARLFFEQGQDCMKEFFEIPLKTIDKSKLSEEEVRLLLVATLIPFRKAFDNLDEDWDGVIDLYFRQGVVNGFCDEKHFSDESVRLAGLGFYTAYLAHSPKTPFYFLLSTSLESYFRQWNLDIKNLASPETMDAKILKAIRTLLNTNSGLGFASLMPCL